MIRGYIDESGVPMVNVTVGGIRSQITIPALVDTGFDGHICLPIALAVNLGLELVGFLAVELADGSTKEELIFRGTGSIGNAQREIEIFLTDSEEALLGRGWFAEGSLIPAPVLSAVGNNPPAVRLDIWKEWQNLEAAIRGPNPNTGRGKPIELKRLLPPTRDRFQRTLANCDVVYFSGHGTESDLLLETERGKLQGALEYFNRSRDLSEQIGLEKDVAEEEALIAEIRRRMEKVGE